MSDISIMLFKALFGQCDNCKITVSSWLDIPCACVQAYKASFTAALEAEHTEEWQLAEERLSTWPEQRLKVTLFTIPLQLTS